MGVENKQRAEDHLSTPPQEHNRPSQSINLRVGLQKQREVGAIIRGKQRKSSPQILHNSR